MHPKLADSSVELKHQLGIVKPGAIIPADADTARSLEKAAPELMLPVKLKIVADSDKPGESPWIGLKDILERDNTDVMLPEPERAPDDVVVFFFTGGTTSLPKPAPLTNANVVLSTQGFIYHWHTSPGRTLVGHLPPFHSYGNFGWYAFWLGGGCVVYPAPVYSPAATLEAIEKEKGTDMPGNPAHDRLIDQSPDSGLKKS